MEKEIVRRNIGSIEVNVFEAFKEFIVEKQALNLSRASIFSYESAFSKFASDLSLTEYVYATDIDKKVIFNWINIMKQREIRITSINSYLRKIRSFLYWCMNEEREYIKPVYKIQELKYQEEPPKHFTEEEIELLIKKPKVKEGFATWRSWAVINFIIGTGARAASVCSVKMGDINFETKEILLEHTKNNKALIIPMSPTLEIALKEYIRIWRNMNLKESYLFPTRSNEKLTSNSLWCETRYYFNERGVKKTNLHGLRHSFAIGWVKNNGNMFVLQKILGHSTLEMTRKYVRLYSDDYKENFEMFNPLDSIKRNKSKKQLVSRNI